MSCDLWLSPHLLPLSITHQTPIIRPLCVVPQKQQGTFYLRACARLFSSLGILFCWLINISWFYFCNLTYVFVNMSPPQRGLSWSPHLKPKAKNKKALTLYPLIFLHLCPYLMSYRLCVCLLLFISPRKYGFSKRENLFTIIFPTPRMVPGKWQMLINCEWMNCAAWLEYRISEE